MNTRWQVILWRGLLYRRNPNNCCTLKPGSNEDESWWELAGESLHECFLDSHCSVKRAVKVAWELTRVFLLFSISLFLLVASPLHFLRFLTLVKLLTVRVITPTVTCQWYVIIFSFFLLLLLMGNDLEIACFCNSLRLSCNSHDRSNEPNLSLTHQNLNQLKVDEGAWELMRVGGQTRVRVATLILVWSGLNNCCNNCVWTIQKGDYRFLHCDYRFWYSNYTLLHCNYTFLHCDYRFLKCEYALPFFFHFCLELIALLLITADKHFLVYDCQTLKCLWNEN